MLESDIFCFIFEISFKVEFDNNILLMKTTSNIKKTNRTFNHQNVEDDTNKSTNLDSVEMNIKTKKLSSLNLNKIQELEERLG